MKNRRIINTLSVDIGGTGLKAAVLNARGRMISPRARVGTPQPCPPAALLRALGKLLAPLPKFHRISVGFPGVVKNGKVLTAPNLGNRSWKNFDLERDFSRRFSVPVRVINDAEMQGFGVIRGRGLELVVTLGTGIGTALFLDGKLTPHLELAHHPVHGNKTYNEYIGDKVRKKGKKKWNRRVRDAVNILKHLINYDRIYLGGGNARHIRFKPDADMRLVSNKAGLTGGIALWKETAIFSAPGRRFAR